MATLLGVVQDMPGFFVARFFLGITESGLFPGVVYYFSMWYVQTDLRLTTWGSLLIVT